MIWSKFASAAPELASEGARRLKDLALVATIRKDGTPRISPVEPFITKGHLLLGMMSSLKASDLLRDPRCLVHNPVSDPQGSEGEFKLRGLAVRVSDDRLWAAYSDSYKAKWGRKPPPPFPRHLFSLDIHEAVSVDWDTKSSVMITRTWTSSSGVKTKKRRYP